MLLLVLVPYFIHFNLYNPGIFCSWTVSLSSTFPYITQWILRVGFILYEILITNLRWWPIYIPYLNTRSYPFYHWELLHTSSLLGEGCSVQREAEELSYYRNLFFRPIDYYLLYYCNLLQKAFNHSPWKGNSTGAPYNIAPEHSWPIVITEVTHNRL